MIERIRAGVHSKRGALLSLGFVAVVAAYYIRALRGYTGPFVIPDEFGYAATAAYLTGHDWSALARGLPWYNYGYSLIIAPFFKLFEPTHWYRAAQGVNIACVLASAAFANAWLRNLVEDRRGRRIIIFAFLMYPSIVFNIHFLWAESLIVLVPWVLLFQLTRIGSGAGGLLSAASFGATLAFTYYIHSRLIVVCLAGFLAFAYLAIYSSRKGFFKTFMASFALCMGLGLWAKDYFIGHVYQGQLGGGQESLASMALEIIDRFGNWSALSGLLCAAAGQLAYLIISSFGLLVPGIFYSIKLIKSHHASGQKGLVAGLIFLLLGFFGSYGLIAVAIGSLPVFPHHVFYGRYTDPLMLPVVVVGLVGLIRGEVRLSIPLVSAVVSAFILVPPAMHLADSLANQTIYWNSIPALFAYRAPGWQLNTHHVLLCFSLFAGVVYLISLKSRRMAVIFVGVMWFLAGVDVTRAYASAPSEHSYSWRIRNDRPNQKYRGVIVFKAVDGDPNFLRTQVQMYNPSAKVIARLGDEVGKSSAVSMPHYHLLSASDGVEQLRCDGAPADGGIISEQCDEISSDDVKVRATLHFAERGPSLRLKGSVLGSRLHAFLSTLPYFRTLWPNLGIDHVKVTYSVSAARSTVVVLKSFVTRVGSTTWLGEKGVKLFASEGEEAGSLSVPVTIRAYDGSPLSKGDYVLHVVVSYPDGNDWSTIISMPLSII